MDITIDKSDMAGVIRKFPEMIEKALELSKGITIEGEFKNICLLGMGGSGFAGDLLKNYMFDSKIDFQVIKGYEINKKVSKETLVFAISYSGNTEETISSYRSCIKRGCTVVAVSSGGKLKELSELNSNMFVEVPTGIQPRLSTPYLFIPILKLLSGSGIIENQDNIIQDAIRNVKKMDLEDNAKRFAEKIHGKIPIIYSSEKIWCIAEKWKTDINENAKTPAFYNLFPEFNHNEINAYINLQGDYHCIMLSDEYDHPRIKARFKIIKQLIKSKGVDVTEINIKGENYLSRLLIGITMGLWISYWLALSYETDPTPVDIIESLKAELKKA